MPLYKVPPLMKYEFEISRGPIDIRKRKLILTPDCIEFEGRHIKSKIPKRLNKTQIKEVRMGMRMIRGIEFPVGREFIFEFRLAPFKIFRIKFSSSFKNRKNNSVKLYNDISNAMWKLYLNDLLYEIEHRLKNGEPIKLAHVIISPEGVSFKKKTSINRHAYFLNWDEVTIKPFHDSFYLMSKKNKLIRRIINLHIDWNAVILYKLLIRRLNN